MVRENTLNHTMAFQHKRTLVTIAKAVSAGAEVPCAVQNAQDFDTYTKTVDGIVTKTYGADGPLTYQWSADKGRFKNGITFGQNVTWIAPDDVTEATNVIIRCTIDDPPGPRVNRPDSGSHDDDPTVRSARVVVEPSTVGASARIYATSSQADLTSIKGAPEGDSDQPKIVSEKAWVVGEITLLKKSRLASGQTALKIKIEDQWEKPATDGNSDETSAQPTPSGSQIPLSGAPPLALSAGGADAEDAKNRAFLSLPLANTENDKFKVQWRKATLENGTVGPWSDGSPLDGNNTDDTLVYRAWIDFKPDAAKKFDGAIGGWDTSVGIVDLDDKTSALTGGTEGNTLFSANGLHKVAIEKVEGGKDKMLLLANPTAADPNGKKEVEVKGETVDVENLTITSVITNAGNPDYLLFDPAADAIEKMAHPSIKFKIEDKGEKHKYVWTIKVNDTNVPSWIKKATVRGVADAPGEVEVHLNDDDWLADHNQTQDKHLEDWGTYSFDVFVAEVKDEEGNGAEGANNANLLGNLSVAGDDKVEGDPFTFPRVDYYAFKQGGKDGKYFLTIPKDADRKRHYVQPKWEEKDGKTRDFFEAGYFLQDKLSKPASKVWFDLYSPRLTQKGSTVDLANTALDTDSAQEVFAATVPIEDDKDWQAEDETHTFIGIFMALDSHAERRRDHKPAHTLAANDHLPYQDGTFKYEKIDQDEPRNNRWKTFGIDDAVYTGSIASTADNIKVQMYPKSRKNIAHANWYVTWGKTAKSSTDNKFPKDIFRVPQGKKADRSKNAGMDKKSVTVTLDLFPSDRTPRAGYYRIGCVVRFEKEGAETTGKVGEFISNPIRVGVRTDDAIVFGWINPNGVTLPSSSGTNPEAKGAITGIFPRGGLSEGNNQRVPNVSTAQTALDLSTLSGYKRLDALYKIGKAALVLGQLAECEDNPYNPGTRVLNSLYVDMTKLMPTGYDPNRLKFGRVFTKETATGDRKYALYWQFKYAANDPAKSSVPRTSTRAKAYDFKDINLQAIDYNRLSQFSKLRQSNWIIEDRVLGNATRVIPTLFLPVLGRAEIGKGGSVYKMLNHFQVRYLLDTPTGTKIEFVRQLKHGIQSTHIGMTADPLTKGLGLSGQPGPLEGKVSPGLGPQGFNSTGIIRQVNDGSPDAKGVKNFATLTRRLNAFWEDIGSQIYFEKGKFEPGMNVQAYPTYEMFVNGDYKKTDPQAANPIGHFYYSPYPFGRGKTSGIFNKTGFQGGRNGESIPAVPSPTNPPIHPSARLAPIQEGMPR